LVFPEQQRAWPPQRASAAASVRELGRIRRLVGLNLVFGLITVVTAGIAVWLQVVLVLFGNPARRFRLMTFEWPEEDAKIEGKERVKLEGAPDTLVAPDDALRERTRELALSIAAHSPVALRLIKEAVRTAMEFDGAFSAIRRERAGGVLVLSTPLFIAGAKRLAELALTHKLPSLFGPKHHVEAGGLMSYSPDRADLYRRGAIYVDKILKGAKPADLPVQQPTKFELVINLKTAKALGLTIPPSLLQRADQVIQ